MSLNKYAMKKFLKFILVPTVILLSIYSCKKDLGNYDYNPANVITITTDRSNVDTTVVINNDSIIVKQNDSLKVNIVTSQTKPSNNLTYQWMVIQSSATIGNPVQYVLGNEMQLRTKII